MDAVRGASALLGAVTVLGVAGCRPAGPAPTAPIPGLPRTEPTVRVGIAVDTAEAVVGADAPFTLTLAGGSALAEAGAGEQWTFTADTAGRLLGESTDGEHVGPVDRPVRVEPRTGDAVLITGRPYRGAALIRAVGPRQVTVVNTVALEEYLLGVVPAEIPATELEAVKAQAVAARTYAIGHLGHRDALGFDFFATVADQVYGGIAEERPTANIAVEETRGQIVSYEGRPILAFYFSTCGGRTAAIQDVWSRPALPYLQSVSDRIPGTEDRYYCETSNRFRWTEEWTGDALAAILVEGLSEYTGSPVGPTASVRDVEVTERTQSGRAGVLEVRLGDGASYGVRGDSIRWVLRPEADRILNSTLLFELEQEREGDLIRRLVVHGGGWGHGVGMCQVGAIGRARAGQDYREILRAYYRGTEVTDLY